MAHRRGLTAGAGERPAVEFTARMLVDRAPGDVFDVLADWPRQTPWVALTVVERRGGRVGGVGEEFAGVSRIGPLVLHDTMRVVATRPPARGLPGAGEVVKTGRLLGGSVSIAVRAVAGGRTEVEWTERIVVRPAPLARASRLAGLLPALAGRLAFEAVLRAARPELEGRG